MWIVSVSQHPAQIRSIFCKGATYPQVLPRPILQNIPWKVPVCEPDSEKGKTEHELLLAGLLSATGNESQLGKAELVHIFKLFDVSFN